jgi:uncharacterized SAM-binding protein YcdF (DUF218 family)
MFKILKPSLILSAAVVVAGLAFKALTPNDCADIPGDAAIFVLTGDARRIPFAKKLLRDFPDRRLYVIGVGGTSALADSDARIQFEKESRNTYENALAIQRIAAAGHLRRIAVVTTEDHMNRSLRLIRHELPDAGVLACPAPLTDMSARHRIARWAAEYFKYIGTLFGFKTRG